MTKRKVVVFYPNGGARIFINPANEEELAKLGTVVVDPNLDHVRGLPPEHWFPEEEHIKTAKILQFRKRRKQKVLRIAASIMLALLAGAIARGLL